MKRLALDELVAWKNAQSRKPLILQGARQTGKTWLIKEFGKSHYTTTAYINFEQSPHLSTIFEKGYNIKKIINSLKIETGISIVPNRTLIVFDEIQAVPAALNSLKYFYEESPEYHIIAAGSLLGITLHSGFSFPVGKVDFLSLFPMNFSEFLLAVDKDLAKLLESLDFELITTFRNRFVERLKQYYFTGGMPEVVSNFIKNEDFNEARKIQKQILNAYEIDFSKHAPQDIVPRIRLLWNSVLAQLTKENKKFIYGQLKSGSRAKDYELSLLWLSDSGLISRVSRVTKPNLPLKSYEDHNAFKLFSLDVGLLAAIGDLDSNTILHGNAIFTEFKGALSEQFVYQQIQSHYSTNIPIHYWSADKSKAETDFVIQFNGNITPIEVKAEENLKAKSLKVYKDKFSPKVSIRVSMSDFRDDGWLINIPLYAINTIYQLLLNQKSISG